MSLGSEHKARRSGGITSPLARPRARLDAALLWLSALLALGSLAPLTGAPLRPLARLFSTRAQALGRDDAVELRRVQVGKDVEEARPKAAERLSWEVRKRTSIETSLNPGTVRLDDPSIFSSPLLYWSSDRAFAPLSEKELSGLRRFVEYGGFIVIDDAAPEAGGFDASVRRALSRAFPGERLARLSTDHTIFRSFYLLDRPAGRVADPGYVEAIMHAGRAAVVYSRLDLGGAWVASDDRGDSLYAITPGGAAQRETAVRFGVNLVMYALCLDYKDDQVHAPFILRRRAGRP